MRVTARDYAQTLELCRLHGLESRSSARTAAPRVTRKLGALAVAHARAAPLGAASRPTLAVAHGSNDLALVAQMLGVPACNTFDYEWATFQHTSAAASRGA